MTTEYRNHVGAPVQHPIVTEFQLRQANELQARQIAKLERSNARKSAGCLVMGALVVLLGLVVIDQHLSRFFHCLLFVWAGVVITIAMQLGARKMLAGPKVDGLIETEDVL